MHFDLHTAITICDSTVMVQNLSLHKHCAEPEKSYYQHRHPGFEMHYVSVGSSRVNCEGKVYHLDTGTMLIIPPGSYHDLVDGSMETTRISFSFNLNMPSRKKAESKGDVFARSFYRGYPIYADVQNSEAQQVLEKIEKLLSRTPEGLYQRDKLLALCNVLLLELADIIPAEKNDLPPAKSTGDLPDVTFQIDAFLGRNFMYHDSMPRMAEELHISTRQLHRMIRKNYQTNYRQKLSETRIKIAIDMLRNSTMPIHRIGEILGYRNSSNFSIFVKRHTGKTPSQIRNACDQKQE